MKAKQTTPVAPTSFEDAGYRFATTGETMMDIARFVLDRCPTFVDECPTEVKTGLYAGFMLKKHELEGDKFYKLGEGGTYIPLKDKPADTDKGIVCMTITSAMSYSPQEFGKLKDTDPARHAIVGPLRVKFSNYAGNAMRTLRGLCKLLQADGQPRQRGANKGFVEAMQAAFDTYEKRVKTAKDRGDNEADPLKFRMARDAFWKIYNA